MQVTITQRDVTMALERSPHRGSLHFFHNPIALAYARELIFDHCAVTHNRIHVSSPSGIEYIQDLLPVAKSAVDEWTRSRTIRLGPLHVW